METGKSSGLLLICGNGELSGLSLICENGEIEGLATNLWKRGTEWTSTNLWKRENRVDAARWPSGLRRQFKALVSSDAWVRIPSSSYFSILILC